MNQNEKRQRLIETLRNFRTAMLMTCDETKRIDAQPMTIVESEDTGVLYFPVGIDSPKVRDGSDAYVTVQADNSYAVARGRVTILNDRATVERLWSEPLRVWFPGGKEDKDLAFLRMEIIDGEYWDVSGINKVRYCLSAFTAYITKNEPNLDDDSMHAKVYGNAKM